MSAIAQVLLLLLLLTLADAHLLALIAGLHVHHELSLSACLSDCHSVSP